MNLKKQSQKYNTMTIKEIIEDYESLTKENQELVMDLIKNLKHNKKEYIENFIYDLYQNEKFSKHGQLIEILYGKLTARGKVREFCKFIDLIKDNNLCSDIDFSVDGIIDIEKLNTGISKQLLIDIKNISLAGQPTTGKSECVIKMVMPKASKTNNYKGDLRSGDNGIEVKDFGDSSAKLSGEVFAPGYTRAIFSLLGATDKNVKLSISKTKGHRLLKNTKNITPERIIEEFTKYSKESNQPKEQIDKDVLETLAPIVANDLKKYENDWFMWSKVWMSFILINYSRVEEFNIFMTTTKLDTECLQYYYINLSGDDYLDMYNRIMEQEYVLPKMIRYNSAHFIEITTRI